RIRQVALHVRVLDAQNERATCVAGEQPVQDGDACVADMQRASGAGREARTDHRRVRCSRIFAPSAPEKPGTSAICWGVALRSARTLPKCASSARWRAGPMPGMSDSSLDKVRFPRSFRLYVTAKR